MPRKRGDKAEKCGLSDEQIPELICQGRTANIADFVLRNADKRGYRGGAQTDPCG